MSRLKSIAIVLLAGLMMYQVGLLWFVNITNRNFWVHYFPFLHQQETPEGIEALIRPRRVLAGSIDTAFSVRYGDSASLRRYGDTLLAAFWEQGVFAGVGTADWADMLSEPAYIFEYGFPMQAEWFALSFGHRGRNPLATRGLNAFSQIVIRPPQASGAEARLYFLDENGLAFAYTVPDSTGHVIPATPVTHTFADGRFYRLGGELPFAQIQRQNPYINPQNELLLSFVQQRVGDFFANPYVIRVVGGSDFWSFSDVNAVVRYHITHVLEYISYRAIDRRGPVRFVDNFSVAVAFIERDAWVLNTFYLAGYQDAGNGRHRFYFNYVLPDRPLLIPEDWPAGAGLRHPLEVTVDHGTVVHYRRLAYNFYLE